MARAFQAKGVKFSFFQKSREKPGANLFLRFRPFSISKMSHRDWNQFGERQLGKGNCRKAIGHFDNALLGLPKSCEYLANRATAVYLLMGQEGRQSQGADASLARAAADCCIVADFYAKNLPKEPTPAEKQHFARFNRVQCLLEDIWRLRGELKLASTYISRAERAQACGNFQNSLADYSEALLLEPDSIPALMGRARLLFSVFNSNMDAASDFRRLAKLAPEGSEGRRLAEKCMERMMLPNQVYLQ